ncbi:hypothetical protein M011DRAFT_439249 [Sporormia fimetaria CBS 119925]|uniref:WD40 repeat-like protein n=1 Tax=Sporormia fimetaria CBS 119925 TaxID=1340428 RepID=A0A6A6VGZ4_9PLEO|nr:hypothetical protein M011DRAFT_439249 [Sporormia fimetaria CBS 119925]
MGKNVHVEFGGTEDEVVVFSDFASKATVWCLRTGRTVEIKDPKFLGREGRGWGYRPNRDKETQGRGKLLAFLCRTAGQDILLVLAPKSYNVLKRVELPTVDAAGIKWSRDGRWIVVWDAASAGYRLHIYTADGHLYRTITREQNEELDRWGIEGLGVKSVEWAPGNGWLAVGGWDRRVRILFTRTFSPIVFLDHTPEIQVPSAPVYTELVDGRGSRSYSLAQQPVTPPKATNEKGDTTIKQGISIVAFNVDGSLCATRDDSTPNTIWIWDLRSLTPRAILIQYSPVKLSQNITKPAGTAVARWDARWLPTGEDKKPALVFGHQQAYILVWPEGKDRILRFENEDGEQSDDSLFDILTGRTPIPKLYREDDEETYRETDIGFEDTFRGKRPPGRGRSVLDESGLDEMF